MGAFWNSTENVYGLCFCTLKMYSPQSSHLFTSDICSYWELLSELRRNTSCVRGQAKFKSSYVREEMHSRRFQRPLILHNQWALWALIHSKPDSAKMYQASDQNSVCILCHFSDSYMRCPSGLCWFCHRNIISRRLNLMKLLIIIFYPASRKQTYLAGTCG